VVSGREDAKRKWKKRTVAVISSSMKAIFGAESLTAVLYYLKDTGVTIEDGVERPKEFIDALSLIFGSGSKAVEVGLVDSVGEAVGISTHGLSLERALNKSYSYSRNHSH
jgi:hypothetical protein